MATGFPSGSNTYVPSFEGSGRLMVDFSRNVKDFAVNRYAAIIKVEKDAGYFLRHTPDEAARGGNANEYLWPDGTAPRWNTVNKEFTYVPFACKRYSFDFSLGNRSVEQADWNIVANYAQTSMSLAMTTRTVNVLNVLQDASQMTQTATATSLGGGKWDVATSSNPYIVKGLIAAQEQINRATNGVVQGKDLRLVISPTLARKMAASGEIKDYLKSSPFAMDVVRNNLQLWGLPDYLYGIQVVIEDTVVVTSHMGASRVDSYAIDPTNAIIVARPGALETTEGTFSSACLFMQEEANLETMADLPGRRTLGRVVENYSTQVVSPISGFLVTQVSA